MDIATLLATTPTNLFIDGEFTPSDTNDTFPVGPVSPEVQVFRLLLPGRAGQQPVQVVHDPSSDCVLRDDKPRF